MGRYSRFGNDLYSGRRSIDFVGRKWLWYTLSGVIVVLAVGGLYFKGLNLGIEFKGGVQYTVTLPQAQVTQAEADRIRAAVAGTGIKGAVSPTVTTSGTSSILVTTESTSNQDTNVITRALMKTANVPETKISQDAVGASWGAQVAHRALLGLIVFLILVALVIGLYFREWKTSVAALVALAHDLVITVGIYSLSGFQVSPATVTGVLTILGFSLYDTVVVFDKVRENTRNLRRSKRTYAELANLAVNQTLVRSINTSIVALLPVGALLYVGVATLGSGDLKDLALALFVGMASGAYSSIFIATPLLVQLKSTEREITQHAARAKSRSRREADRYANVPSFNEGVPMNPDQEAETQSGFSGYAAPVDEPTVEPMPSHSRRPAATGSGRTTPTAKAPMRESGSAKRSQPSRQPRSKRGKG
ncbi:MAG: protein translocase subunit SecF [Actinomycetota bacterium]|nr:protein translocase subunit SecF [Actinomycetota bacterium]